SLVTWDPVSPGAGNKVGQHEGVIWGACELHLPNARSAVLSWSEDKTLRLWDPLQPNMSVCLGQHEYGVLGACQIVSREQFFVLSWSRDHTSRLWNVSKPGECLSVERLRNPLEWAKVIHLSDGQTIVTAESSGTLEVYDPFLPSAKVRLGGSSELY